MSKTVIRRHSRGAVQRDLGLTEEQMEYITRAFRTMDTNGNGLISKTELEKAARLSGFNPSKKEVEKMVATVDEDGNGQIDLREFSLLMRDQLGALDYQQMAVQDAFRLLDADGNGYIDYNELRAVLMGRGDPLTEEEFSKVVEGLDVNKDGRIEYEELAQKMCSFPVLEELQTTAEEDADAKGDQLHRT